MAAPFKVYARQIWVNVTAEQLERLKREASLRNTNISEVVRECVDLHLGTKKRRRRST
jgi:hypothetical protein